MSKTDARVRYTRRVIKESFLSLLSEKPVNKITVKEVCEAAEINRATFYSHYSDCFALMESIEQEILVRALRLKMRTMAPTSHHLLRLRDRFRSYAAAPDGAYLLAKAYSDQPSSSVTMKVVSARFAVSGMLSWKRSAPMLPSTKPRILTSRTEIIVISTVRFSRRQIMTARAIVRAVRIRLSLMPAARQAAVAARCSSAKP